MGIFGININGIGEELVTLNVDSTTYTKLLAMKNADGRVEIPQEGLAVRLSADDTVGFGTTATGADTDILFGFIRSFNGKDPTVGVQFRGFVQGAKTKAAIGLGITKLIVTNDGLVNTGATAGESGIMTVKAATAGDLTANFLI